VDSTFEDAVWQRNRVNILRQEESDFVRSHGRPSFEVALRDKLNSRDQAAIEFHSARAQLLAELGRTSATDPAAPAIAQDVLVLAWRLSAAERHALLVSAIEAHPAVEAAVVESLFRCVLEEFALATPGSQQGLLRQLLPVETPVLPTRHEVQRRPKSRATAVWTPDPVLRALDAAELVEAWLAATNQPGRLDRADRCYRLLDLSFGCVTPELTPGTSPVHRTGETPFLVATHALFPSVQAVASQLNDSKLSSASRRLARPTTSSGFWDKSWTG